MNLLIMLTVHEWIVNGNLPFFSKFNIYSLSLKKFCYTGHTGCKCVNVFTFTFLIIMGISIKMSALRKQMQYFLQNDRLFMLFCFVRQPS